MRPEEIKPLFAAFSRLGDGTRAAVIIEMTHDGNVTAQVYSNNSVDAAFMAMSFTALVQNIITPKREE